MRFTSVQGQLASNWSFSGHSKGMTLVEADAAVPVGRWAQSLPRRPMSQAARVPLARNPPPNTGGASQAGGAVGRWLAWEWKSIDDQ